MKLNKKGFTLVELLAVIVILAVVMLVAITAIGPVMERSTKGALSSSAQIILAGAENAYTMDQMNSSKKFKSGSTYCVAVSELLAKNYFDNKGKQYWGSVKIAIDAAGKATYTIYLQEQNTTYYIDGKTAGELGVDAVQTNSDSKEHSNLSKCGKADQTMTTLT